MKKILSVLLAGMLLLTACAKPETDGDEAVDFGDGIVLKVGTREMTANQFCFFLDDIKSQMQGTELSADSSWETTEIEGKKAIDIAKERAYESAVQYLSGIEIAEKMGMSYTDEEMSNIKSQIRTEYFDKYKDGEKIIELMCESIIYMNKLQEKMVEEQGVTEDEQKEYFNNHREELEGQYMRAKHVLFLTQDSQTKEKLSDDKIAEQKKKAEEILARAKKGEDFDALVEEYSEDPGSKSNPDGYVFTTGEMVQEFEDCVRSLKAGEIGFAETDYGYHIIKRLELNAEVCKDIVTDAVYLEKFKKYIEDMTEEYDIEVVKNAEEYDKIK